MLPIGRRLRWQCRLPAGTGSSADATVTGRSFGLVRCAFGFSNRLAPFLERVPPGVLQVLGLPGQDAAFRCILP